MLKKINKNTKKNTITYLLVILAWAVIELLSKSGKLSHLISGMLVLLCVYSIMAVSLNLTVGILGELSLGHAGFMCIGAFSSAFFTQCFMNTGMGEGIRFLLAILVGVAAAGLFGLLIGIPVLRLKGDYLAIVTLAFGEIIKNICNVMFVGKDSHGLHFSMKDTAALGMDVDGTVIINGAQGITRTPRQATFTIGIIILLIAFIIFLFDIGSTGQKSHCVNTYFE